MGVKLEPEPEPEPDLTIITGHVHWHHLYEAVALQQLPQKQLRHVEEQDQVGVIGEIAVGSGAAIQRNEITQ